MDRPSLMLVNRVQGLICDDNRRVKTNAWLKDYSDESVGPHGRGAKVQHVSFTGTWVDLYVNDVLSNE